jgi:hypothetical protein
MQPVYGSCKIRYSKHNEWECSAKEGNGNKTVVETVLGYSNSRNRLFLYVRPSDNPSFCGSLRYFISDDDSVYE